MEVADEKKEVHKSYYQALGLGRKPLIAFKKEREERGEKKRDIAVLNDQTEICVAYHSSFLHTEVYQGSARLILLNLSTNLTRKKHIISEIKIFTSKIFVIN